MISFAALLPMAGDRTSPLPFILIGVAVLLVVVFVIVNKTNKNDKDN